jgi:hypothetical protein
MGNDHRPAGTVRGSIVVIKLQRFDFARVSSDRRECINNVSICWGCRPQRWRASSATCPATADAT